MKNPGSDLDDLRRQIDELDIKLVELVNQRARCALAIGHRKQAVAGAAPVIYYRPEREMQVLRRAVAANPGPLPDPTLARLCREVISACMALEQQLHVAFVGDHSGASVAALRRHFGHAVDGLCVPSSRDALMALRQGTVDYVVLAQSALVASIAQDRDNSAEDAVLIGITAADCVDQSFAVLGRETIAPSGSDATALLVAVEQPPVGGELARKSFPGATWVEIAGHRNDACVDALIQAAQPTRILGSYPLPVEVA